VRLVFFGTATFAVPSLEAAAARHRVSLCVTRPDRPRGRGRSPGPSPVKEAALRMGLSVAQPERLEVGALGSERPEAGIVAAYGRLIPPELLRLPRHGMLGVHPSLLPRYRGAAPVAWAILNGEATTGVSIFRLSEELDAGEIITQRSVAIEPGEDALALSDRLAHLGAATLLEALEAVEAGRADATPQQASQASLAPKLTKAQGRINWVLPAAMIERLVRAAVPWPGAVTEWQGRALKIWQVSVGEAPAPRGAAPGTIVRVEADALTVAAGEGTVTVSEVQPEGRRRMSATAFLAGHPVGAGERFGAGP